MLPSFSFHLQTPIVPGLVTAGKFDGRNPSIACATSADSVVVHVPHDRNLQLDAGVTQDIKQLAVNQRISALAAGDLHVQSSSAAAAYLAEEDTATNKDVLLVGTPSNLLAYDVDANRDIFFKDVPDGVNAVVCGPIPGVADPLALVGGNCSLQGFNWQGNESFWSVTGDNVSALALREPPAAGAAAGFAKLTRTGTKLGSGISGPAAAGSAAPAGASGGSGGAVVNGQQLIVGCEDGQIRVFHQDAIIHEAQEHDAVSALVPIKAGSSLFGYGLRAGSAGVYDNARRLWQAKSKHSLGAITSFDLDGDGVPELVCGWAGGQLEIRRDTSGEVVYRDQLGSAIAGIVASDYRLDGRTHMVCVGVDGHVRGYLPLDEEQRTVLASGLAAQLSGGMSSAPAEQSAEAVAMAERGMMELAQKRHELLTALRGYETNLKEAKERGVSAGVVPPDTNLSVSTVTNANTGSIVFNMSTSNDTLIKAVILTHEGLFASTSSATADAGTAPTDCLLVHASKPGSTLSVAVSPPASFGSGSSSFSSSAAAEVRAQVIVGYRGSTQDHVFEQSIKLPRFASFTECKLRDTQQPKSKLVLPMREQYADRLARVSQWLGESFFVDTKQATGFVSNDAIVASFVNLRDRSPLIVRMSSENGGQVQLMHDDMDMAGDIMQHLCAFLKISDAQTVADFPVEMEQFAEVVRKVEEFSRTRQQFSTELADSSNTVKMLIIKAEDARLLDDMAAMRRAYADLQMTNSGLIAEYNKRAGNHAALLSSLKEVNKMISKASKLRVGRFQSELVAACRAAVKANNVQSLTRIIRVGAS